MVASSIAECGRFGRTAKNLAGRLIGIWSARDIVSASGRSSGTTSPRPKLPDLAGIFAVDAVDPAGYVDLDGRLGLRTGGLHAPGRGLWQTEGVCGTYG
jgi:hypothetical protein